MALDFSRNYNPPGVYIDESESTLVSVTGIPPTLVAIVGPARGYQTNTEQISLSDTAPVRLAKQGIDLNSVKVTVVATGAVVDPTDYVLTPSGPTTDKTYYVDVTPAATPTVPAGTPLFFTYQYTDPEYYSPKFFENFEDVKDIYGEPLNTAVMTAADTNYQYVTSSLSLAALLAFQNGATELWLCPAAPPDATATTDAAKSTARRTNLNTAVKAFDSNSQINVIVALTTGIADADAAGTLTDFKNALANASLDGHSRFGVIGFDPAIVTDPDTLITTAAASYLRLMLAYAAPAGLRMYSGAGNTTFSVGHQYLAAAYAGRMAALPVHFSLTKQVIAGFIGLSGTPLANSLKNRYSSNGVAVSEVDRFGRLSVRHGVTTDPTNVNTREAAVVRAKDALLTSLSDGMDASGLIGSPITADTLFSVKSAVQGVLESAVATETIVSYTGLAARQTSTDPSVIEVKFAYKPAYPLNYIVISFSIDMTTGATNDTNTDNTVV